jgi:N-methylhydantoinase A
VPVSPDEELADAFHRAHEARYGYADRGRPIELVAVRTAEVRPAPPLELPPPPAEPLCVEGPAVLALEGATCFIAPGWVGVRDGTDPALRQRSSTLRLTKA